VSLALARNEESGLRCLYHGWQFDVSGKCVDVPNEYDHKKEAIAASIKVRHFPVLERGQLIWVYLGQGEAPAFPNFEWLRDEISHAPRGAILHCNWLQTMEGNLDPDHVGQLHSSWFLDIAKQAFSVRPIYEVVDQPWGFTGAASRKYETFAYHRVKEMALPWYAHIPFNADESRSCLVSIPIDDETTYVWYLAGGSDSHVKSDGDTPSSESLVGQPPGVEKWQYMIDTRLTTPPDDDNFRSTVPHDPAAMWDQNRDKMTEGHFTGLPGFVMEDFAVFESMGKIQDRTKEHLVVSDQFIGRLRRQLITEVKKFAETGVRAEMDYSQIIAIAGMTPPETNWRDLIKPDVYAAEASPATKVLVNDDVHEHWELVIDTPMGKQKLALAIKVDGSTVTGTATGNGETSQIMDGVANGTSLKWKTKVKKPMSMQIAFDVIVDGENLSGTFKPGPFPSGAVSGRRLAAPVLA
jgi:hypothetical protein